MTDDHAHLAYRDDLEPFGEQIPDVDGRIGAPAARVVDTLRLLLLHGTIGPREYEAGEQFRGDFALAQLEPLQAIDLCKAPGVRSNGDLPNAVYDAKDRVWRALWAIGGPFTPMGSAAWYVVGCGWTLAKFASDTQFGRGGGSMAPCRARDLVVGACSNFAVHFGLVRT